MLYPLNTGSDKRTLDIINDTYDTPLDIEYGLFEDPLESILLMHFIENNFMIDLFSKDVSNKHLQQYDDIQLHLLSTQYEVDNTNYFMAHLENATQKFDKCPFQLNTEYMHSVTTLLEIPTYTEALNTHINL